MTGEDITPLKKIQKGVSDKDILITAVLNAIHIGISVTDSRGRFVYLNNTYGELHGYSIDELVNRPLTTIVPPENQNTILRHYFSFITSGGDKPLTETRKALHRKGSILELAVVAQRVGQVGDADYVVWTVTLPAKK
jgi:PAS domain S-box-containing protein